MVGVNGPNRLLAGWMPKGSVLRFTPRDFTYADANAGNDDANTKPAVERILLRQLSCNDDGTPPNKDSVSDTATAGFRMVVLPRVDTDGGGVTSRRVYYISFRTDHGVDKKISQQLRYKVLVHSGPDVGRYPRGSSLSLVRASGGDGDDGDGGDGKGKPRASNVMHSAGDQSTNADKTADNDTHQPAQNADRVIDHVNSKGNENEEEEKVNDDDEDEDEEGWEQAGDDEKRDDGTEGFHLVSVLDEKGAFTSVQGTFTLSVLTIDRHNQNGAIINATINEGSSSDHHHYYAVLQIQLHVTAPHFTGNASDRPNQADDTPIGSPVFHVNSNGNGNGKDIHDDNRHDNAVSTSSDRKPSDHHRSSNTLADSISSTVTNTDPQGSTKTAGNASLVVPSAKSATSLATIHASLACMLVAAVAIGFWKLKMVPTFGIITRTRSLGSLFAAPSSTGSASANSSDNIGKGRASTDEGGGRLQRQMSWDNSHITQWGARMSSLQLLAPPQELIQHAYARDGKSLFKNQPQNLDGMVVIKKQQQQQAPQTPRSSPFTGTPSVLPLLLHAADHDTVDIVDERTDVDFDLVWDGVTLVKEVANIRGDNDNSGSDNRVGITRIMAMFGDDDCDVHLDSSYDRAGDRSRSRSRSSSSSSSSSSSGGGGGSSSGGGRGADDGELTGGVWVPRPPALMPQTSKLTFRRTTTEQ